MGNMLPAAAWTKREDLAGLMIALGDSNARYVGGAVRDTLLGLEVKDIDLATPLVPDEVISRLGAAGIRTVPTGIAHGTVTALLKEGPVEITTLRHDVSTDGRRATVAFAQSWHDDAARRDFTINALYADPVTSEVFDYFGGLEDLAARRVRFIGDARERIREDHLRILRYFRFQARFGSQPADAESENACAELAATLKGLSRERIGMEVLNLLSLPDPAATVARMGELGVLAVILPEAVSGPLAALVAEEQRQNVSPNPIRRLAALLPADVSQAERVSARFRLSRTQRERLASASKREVGLREKPHTFAYRLGIELAIDRLLLIGADVTPLEGWVIPVFPLKGGEIVARGVTVGPEVARILKAVEDLWVEEAFPNKARVEELLAEELSRST